MKIINPSYEVLDHLDQQSLAVRIELCGRICYKSEDRIDQDSALPLSPRRLSKDRCGVWPPMWQRIAFFPTENGDRSP
jgi:thymidylate synthase (FAD)